MTVGPDTIPGFDESLKWADTVPKVHDLIRRRWSPRSFSDREISDEDLTAILEAARWAASSSNEQPWRFLMARKVDEEAFHRLLHLLNPSNQVWCRNASVLMFVAARKTFSSGAVNFYAMHDVGQAVAQMFLQATALGFHAHGMAGYDRERAVKVLGLPPEFDLGPAIAFGYLGPLEQLTPELQAREKAHRQRRPLGELAFGSTWDSKAPLQT